MKLTHIILFCTFIGEIGGIDPPLNGFVLRPSLLLSNISLSNTIMKRIEYKNGDQVGECIYLYDIEPYILNGKTPFRRAIFRCKCGNEFKAKLNLVKFGSVKSCGCLKSIPENNPKYRHGLAGTKEYKLWCSIKKRCYNEKEPAYKYYGGRCINIYNEWFNDPKSFIGYIKSLPGYGSHGLTLDRINNDGNYEPGNLRWASRHIQSTNQRAKKNNKSGYIGAVYNKNANKYSSLIILNKKRIYLGFFVNPRNAAIARDIYIIKNNLSEYKLQVLSNE